MYNKLNLGLQWRNHCEEYGAEPVVSKDVRGYAQVTDLSIRDKYSECGVITFGESFINCRSNKKVFKDFMEKVEQLKINRIKYINEWLIEQLNIFNLELVDVTKDNQIIVQNNNNSFNLDKKSIICTEYFNKLGY